MIFSGRKKFKISEEAGVIIGYEITEKVFKPVLELSKKGEQGWKIPIFIKSLINNPAPLILKEHWVYDKGAVDKAISWLKSDGVKGVDKLEFLFKESKSFESASLQTLFNEKNDVDSIVDEMKACEESDFWGVIKPLEDVYGTYAWPNNYEFERMNAGIIKCLSVKFPNLSPLDDSLRAPVYEFLGSAHYEDFTEKKELVGRIVKVTQDCLFPIPRFKSDWNPAEFIKLHKSKSSKQLREIIESLRSQREISDQNLASYISDAKSLSLSFSSTRDVVYAFGGLGGSILAAIKSTVNPYLYIPTAIFTLISADKFYITLTNRIQKEKLRWLDVATQLAEWSISREKNQ